MREMKRTIEELKNQRQCCLNEIEKYENASKISQKKLEEYYVYADEGDKYYLELFNLEFNYNTFIHRMLGDIREELREIEKQLKIRNANFGDDNP